MIGARGISAETVRLETNVSYVNCSGCGHDLLHKPAKASTEVFIPVLRLRSHLFNVLDRYHRRREENL